uniref:DDE Tnp4 domain-containing protein n=1 Tax=Brassica oleracea var. oleracea TaxID=109376 RepID=A0A0D3E0K5_BRAOL
MSSSSSDGLEKRVDELFDEIVEDTYNDIVEAETILQRTRAYVERHREGGEACLWNDYFSEDATFSSHLFRRRFRMNKNLFLRLQRRDATGRFGLSALQKCTAAIRLLAYGTAADTIDEYLRLGETTTLSCLHNLTDGIIQLFGDEYLRRPTPEDLQRLLDIGEKRWFPGMVGSIDCMHWEWKNCPTAWKGQYARTLNDINVLDRSPVFDDILEGRAPRVKYMVNGHMYKLAYYLTDGIYLKWSTFIQSITLPQTPQQELFAKVQETTRKDVERAFGVLQARFAIVRNPVKTLDKEKIWKIMRACIIQHNMIVEDERDGYTRIDISEFEEGDVTRSSQVET